MTQGRGARDLTSFSRFITNRARLTCIFSNALTAILVVFAYWNISAFVHKVANFPPHQSNDLVVSEERYRPIKYALIGAGYKHGPVRFLTRRDIQGEKLTDEDHVHWVISQYVMVPWIMLLDRRPVTGPAFSAEPPFVIGDFWDGEPPPMPADFVLVHNPGNGLILYRRKTVQ